MLSTCSRPCPSSTPSPLSFSASFSYPGLLSNIHSGNIKFCLQSSAPWCPQPATYSQICAGLVLSFPAAGNLNVTPAQLCQTPSPGGIQNPIVTPGFLSMEQLLFSIMFFVSCLSIFSPRPWTPRGRIWLAYQHWLCVLRAQWLNEQERGSRATDKFNC